MEKRKNSLVLETNAANRSLYLWRYTSTFEKLVEL